jgi:adenylyltransferase/sulfurtransferase
LIGRLVLLDALEMKFRELKLRRDPQCPICGPKPTLTELVDYEQFCGVAPASSQPALRPDEVTVHDMRRALEDPASQITVIDVREPDEYRIAHFQGAVLMPLSALPQRFLELDPNRPYYLHCKAGLRSLKALSFLRNKGFKDLKSVHGGIAAWSEQIDPSVPKY